MEVVEDVLQMYSNCELYNEENSALVRAARKQRKLFNIFLSHLELA